MVSKKGRIAGLEDGMARQDIELWRLRDAIEEAGASAAQFVELMAAQTAELRVETGELRLAVERLEADPMADRAATEGLTGCS